MVPPHHCHPRCPPRCNTVVDWEAANMDGGAAPKNVLEALREWLEGVLAKVAGKEAEKPADVTDKDGGGPAREVRAAKKDAPAPAVSAGAEPLTGPSPAMVALLALPWVPVGVLLAKRAWAGARRWFGAGSRGGDPTPAPPPPTKPAPTTGNPTD